MGICVRLPLPPPPPPLDVNPVGVDCFNNNNKKNDNQINYLNETKKKHTLLPLISELRCCIISSKSSFNLYLFSLRFGVNVYCESSGSGLSQPFDDPLCSFLFNA